MKLAVTRRVLEAMRAAEREAFPHEACGILLGEDQAITGFVPTRNVHPDPGAYFEIDPQALIDAHRSAREGGPQVVGYFHSHPSGEAIPSITDREMSSGDGRVWAISAAGEIAFWRDDPDGFVILSCKPDGLRERR